MLPTVVIGAGPVGLAAAAELHERGLPFLVLETGNGPAATVAEWAHVRLFSPWRYDTASAARRLLEPTGWQLGDPDHLPTGEELISGYLAPLAAHPALAPHVRYGTRVAALSREGTDRVRSADREKAAFVLRLGSGEELRARAIIDASGTWWTRNALGANGLPPRGEPEAADAIEPSMPDVLGADRARFAGRHTLVVGAGHSAATTLLALAEIAASEPETTVTWAIRSGAPESAYGGENADALPGRGALGSGLRRLVESGAVELRTGFGVRSVSRTPEGRVAVAGKPGDADGSPSPDGEPTLVVDRIVAATGYRPDHAIADELRLDLDPALGCSRALAPLIDPNVHSCGTVRPHGVDELAQPEPEYWIVGSKSYGRAPTFLLATGYEQVRSIAAALAGDWEAARETHLELPETGVCSATAGAREIAADAAARLGLDDDVPARLVSAIVEHYFRVGEDLDAAVHAAASDLGIEPQAAQQLAVLVSEQLEAMLTAEDSGRAHQPERPGQDASATVDPQTPLETAAAAPGGGCCN